MAAAQGFIFKFGIFKKKENSTLKINYSVT